MMAGNFAATREGLRTGYNRSGRSASRAFRSTTAALLARASSRRGVRRGRAVHRGGRGAGRARRPHDPDHLAGRRARLLADRGSLTTPSASHLKPCHWRSAPTSSTHRADALIDLAAVLEAADRTTTRRRHSRRPCSSPSRKAATGRHGLDEGAIWTRSPPCEKSIGPRFRATTTHPHRRRRDAAAGQLHHVRPREKLDVTGFIKYAKANITSLTVRIEQRDTDGTLIAGAQGTLWDAEVKAAIVDDGAMTKDDDPPEEQPTWGMKLKLSPKTGSFKPDQPVNGTAVYTRAGVDPRSGPQRTSGRM